MITWPEQLKRDLIARKVVVFLGGGVSRNSVAKDQVTRPPLWAEFIQSGLDRVGSLGTSHIKKAIRDNDLLHACEWLKKRMDEEWVPFLREKFLTPVYAPSDVHRAIFKLDQKIYLTPNFDQIFENFVTSETGGQVTVKKYYEADVHNFLREDGVHIIKVHGSIDNPNELIFTHHDYAKARIKHSAFYEVMDACLMSHTFLILGCGIADPDLALLLENHRFSFPHSRPHYLVTPSKISSDMIGSLRANRNLKCITYDPTDNHKQLLESLNALVEVIDAPPDLDGGVFG